ncbi:MAG: SDR family oxidoreductase [Sphingomonadales bacterium]|nr:MAG: SDR family oxidoreductase [Sphingomonadales bacterium]
MTTAMGTALVTGASSGIGAVYADRLAHRGYDLVLVARDAGRLDALAQKLEAESGRRVEPMPADLTDRAQLARIEDRLAGDPAITLLVNNAGMSLSGTWLTVEPEAVERLIALNTIAPTMLARAAANAFCGRGGGAIVNVASVLALAPELFDGAYAGTKAHLLNLSLSIASKLADQGVYCQAVLPGTTRTEIFERSGKDLTSMPAEWVMEADDLVDAALIGFDRRETVTIPSLPDEAQWTAMLDARLAMVPNLQNRRVGARYGIGA